jgi:ABC-type lipoprotein export system ATPase subunit
MTVLRATGITKRYGPRNLFSDLSVTIGPGELVAIAGQPGRGKSTLLRCLAGVVPIDSGTLEHVAPVAGIVTTVGTDAPRLAIGSIANDPMVIFVDEPTAWLTSDPDDVYPTRRGDQVVELLEHLLGIGHALIVGTHDPRITNIADEVIAL